MILKLLPIVNFRIKSAIPQRKAIKRIKKTAGIASHYIPGQKLLYRLDFPFSNKVNFTHMSLQENTPSGYLVIHLEDPFGEKRIERVTEEISSVIEKSKGHTIPDWAKKLPAVSLPAGTMIRNLYFSDLPVENDFRNQIFTPKVGSVARGEINETLRRLIETASDPEKTYRKTTNTLTIDDIRDAKDGFLKRMGLSGLNVFITRKLFGYRFWKSSPPLNELEGDSKKFMDETVVEVEQYLKSPSIQGVSLGIEVPREAFPFIIGAGLLDEIDGFEEPTSKEIVIKFLC